MNIKQALADFVVKNTSFAATQKGFSFSVIGNEPYKSSKYKRPEQLENNIGHVFTCTDIIATSVAEIGYMVKNRKTDELVEPSGNTPVAKFAKIIAQPNENTIPFSHNYITTAQFSLNGGAFIFLGESPTPLGFWVLPSHKTDIKVSSGEIVRYTDTSKAKPVHYDPEHVLYIKRPNPDITTPYGLSVVQAAALSIDAYNYMKTTNNTLLKNDNIPQHVIMSKQPKLNTDQALAIRDAFDATYGRGRSGYGKTGVLGADMTIEKLRLTPQELEFLESDRLTREDIFSFHKVPLNRAGIKTTNDNKNTTETDKQYMRGTVKPILEMFSQHYSKLAIKYGDYEVTYDESKVTFEDQKFIHEQEMDWLDTGVVNVQYIQDKRDIAEEYRPEEKEPEAEPEKEPEKSVTPLAILNNRAKEVKTNDSYRESVRRKTNRIIKRYEPKITKVFVNLLDKAVDTKKGLRDDLELDSFLEELAVISAALTPEALQSGFKHVQRFLSSDIEIPANSARVAKFISDRKNLMKNSINKTLFEEIKKQLSESQSLGETITQLEKRLRKIGTDNAHRVAVTETTATFNEGSMYSMELNNINKKSWLTMRDRKVRAAHAAIDGETIEIRQLFSNGLDYPSEPNCRCTVIPVGE